MEDIVFTSKKKESRSEEMAKSMRALSLNTYSPGVLLGNWVEERVQCPPNKNLYFPKEKHYDVIINEIIRQEDFRLNKKHATRGSMLDVLPHNHLKNCRNNMTTTTDLAYNHYPKAFYRSDLDTNRSKTKIRQHPNIATCVGNLTSWGLSEEKRAEWACALDLSNRMVTSFQYDFLPPSLKDYVKERKYTSSSFTKSFHGFKK